MWHYIYKIVCKNSEYFRAGTYLVYEYDTFDYLINSPDWAFNNNALDEQSYVLDNLENTFESMDGDLIYVPDIKNGC